MAPQYFSVIRMKANEENMFGVPIRNQKKKPSNFNRSTIQQRRLVEASDEKYIACTSQQASGSVKTFSMPPNLIAPRIDSSISSENIVASIPRLGSNIPTFMPLSDLSNMKTIEVCNTDGNIIAVPVFSKCTSSKKNFLDMELHESSEKKVEYVPKKNFSMARLQKVEIDDTDDLDDLYDGESDENKLPDHNNLSEKEWHLHSESNELTNHGNLSENEWHLDSESVEKLINHGNLSTKEWHPCCREVYKILRFQSQCLKILTDNVAHLRGSVSVLNETVMNTNKGEIHHQRQKYDMLPNFPINTVQDFECFNDRLQESEEASQEFEKYLLSIGGNKIEKKVRNALSSTLTDDLGCSYNWTGTRGGKKMQNTYFSKIFLRTFNQMQGATKYDVQEVFKEWLRRSSDRKNNAIKKKDAVNSRI